MQNFPQSVGKPLASQKVAIGAASVQSTAFDGQVNAVYLVATVACFVEVAASPTAVADTSMYLPADTPVVIDVARIGNKIAVIRLSSDGSLYITELTR